MDRRYTSVALAALTLSAATAAVVSGARPLSAAAAVQADTKIYAVSPDGARVASVEDRGVVLTPRAGGGEAVTLAGTGTRKVTAITFSPDGRLVALGGDDRTVRLYDAETGRQLRDLNIPGDADLVTRFALAGFDPRQRPKSNITAIAFNPAASQVVVTDSGLKAIFRFIVAVPATSDAAAMFTLVDVHASRTPLFSVASDGGDGWVSGDGNGVFHFYDSSLKEIGNSGPRIAGPIRSIAVDPKNAVLASGDAREVKLWNFPRAAGVVRFPSTFTRTKRRDVKESVTHLAFQSGSATLFYVNAKGQSGQWNTETEAGDQEIAFGAPRTPVTPPVTTPPVTTPPVTTPPVTPPPVTTPPVTTPPVITDRTPNTGTTRPVKPAGTGNPRVATAPPPTGLPTTFSFTNARPLIGHSKYVNAVTFSPNGKLVASGGRDNTVRLWDATTGAPRAVLGEHGYWVAAVHFSPDGSRLVSGGWDNKIKLWDVGNQRELTATKFDGHTSYVLSVDFDRTGTRMATGSNDKTARLWSLTGGAARKSQVLPDAVAAVAFSPDGKRVAGGGLDGKIYVWDAATMKLVRTLPGASGQKVFTLVFLSNDLVVAAGEGGFVRVWNTATGKPGATLLPSTGKDVFSVAYNPRKRLLVSGGTDKLIRVWYVSKLNNFANAASKPKPIRTLTGHKNTVRALAFSEDGARMASGGWDNLIFVWEVKASGGSGSMAATQP